jgi:hypothetical protein
MITLGIMISSIIPNVVYAECHHAEGHCAECCGADHKVRFTQCVFAVGYQLPKWNQGKLTDWKRYLKTQLLNRPV